MDRYSMRPSLQQSTRQEQLLLPRMLQSIEVLQLPAMELSAFLREMFEQNEALSLEEAPPGERGEGPGGEGPGTERRGSAADTDRHDQMLQNHPAPAKGLSELLEEQLALLEIDPDLERWVRLVVGCLDDNGYLSTSDESLLVLAEELGLDGGQAQLGRAIAAVQALEPRGIGGRDLTEVLLLQLDPKDPDYALLCALLEDFLEDVAKNKLPQVARSLGVELDRLGELLELLRELDPIPAAGLSEEAAPILRPDVLVERTHEGLTVRVDHSGLPEVRIDDGVRALARDPGQSADVKRYLRGRIDHARWVVQAVEQRKETLLRVASMVCEHQRAFIEEGPGHLVPLRMNQVADWLGVSVSTISRAVSGKHVQTPHGIFPLRHLFQSEVAGGDARDDVRSLVRAVVEAEDPGQPLSDDEIVALLAERGQTLARRTVAKYRKELGIPSSYRRRRFLDA